MAEQLISINGRTVAEIVASHACVQLSEVEPHTKPIDDLGLDSLDSVELCMKLEQEFVICIPDEKWDQVDTVAQIEDLVKSIQTLQ